jgi:RimJ/RimL family protein N-acetyltransferase
MNKKTEYLFRDKNSFRKDGKSVYIKQPEFGELDYVEELWSDEETMKDVGGIIPFPIERRKPWYEKMVCPTDEKNFYCLIYNHDDVPVGEVSFHRFNIEEKIADFNIKVQHKYRNKGYGKEAMKLLLRYYFYDFGGQVVFDDVINEKGQKALQSFGFESVSKCGNEILFKMTKERFTAVEGLK